MGRVRVSRASWLLWGLAALAALAPSRARAAGSPGPVVDEAQAAELEKLRGELGAQVQLQAYDLLDELVFEWTQHPLFGVETPVILADVTVPVSLGTGLKALVENHFAALVVNHRQTRLVLTHCPECSAYVVRSGAKGTVVARGYDSPEVLSAAASASGSRHAIFLDFEAEGTSLVLRARVTRLTPELPIVFATSLSSATSGPPLLRSEEALVSAAAARKEHLEALENRGLLTVPIHVGVRNYATSPSASVAASPYVWLQGGVEVAFTQARVWAASFSIGYTWLPEVHDGWMAQARISRLLTGRARSLTLPDLYFFFGASVTSVQGADSTLFDKEVVDSASILAAARGTLPRATFGAFHLGLELRVKNRIGVSAFLEALPTLGDAPALGSFVDLGFVKFQGFGAEASFCF